MQTNAPEKNSECNRFEAAMYLEGELSPKEEIAFETHLARCKPCLEELNIQKKMLSVLDSAMKSGDEIELPKDFTKTVVVNAESKVSGLRSVKERKRAFKMCAMLFPAVLLTIFSEPKEVFSVFSNFAEQAAAVAAFVWHIFYDTAVGVSVILGTVSRQSVFKSETWILTVAGGFVISFLLLSRLLIQYHRPQKTEN